MKAEPAHTAEAAPAPSVGGKPQRILIVKLTSLGDIVKALPVIEDIRAARPGVAIDWVVERPGDGLLALHPGLSRVIPLELRRYRKEGRYGEALRALRRDIVGLRAERYAQIVDLQGRMKSALTACVARGPVSGPASGPASEPMYAWFYRKRVPRPLFEGLDAIEVNRAIAAAALGYPPPASAPRFRLDARAVPLPEGLAGDEPMAVLVHGCSKAEKAWPAEQWIAVGRWLAGRGLRCLLPWGNEAERLAAMELATGIGAAACVPSTMPSLVQWVGLLGRASLVIGVDSGLTHLAAASGAPTLAIFVSTSPGDFGVRADTPHSNLGDGRRPVASEEVVEAAGFLLGEGSSASAPSECKT